MKFRIEHGIGIFVFLAACCVVWLDFNIKRPIPKKVEFASPMGKLTFNHEFHAGKEGPGLSCSDCHHNLSVDSKATVEMKCRQCHYQAKAPFDSVCAGSEPHKRCIGNKCQQCHSGEECGFCHRPSEEKAHP